MHTGTEQMTLVTFQTQRKGLVEEMILGQPVRHLGERGSDPSCCLNTNISSGRVVGDGGAASHVRLLNLDSLELHKRKYSVDIFQVLHNAPWLATATWAAQSVPLSRVLTQAPLKGPSTRRRRSPRFNILERRGI